MLSYTFINSPSQARLFIPRPTRLVDIAISIVSVHLCASQLPYPLRYFDNNWQVYISGEEDMSHAKNGCSVWVISIELTSKGETLCTASCKNGINPLKNCFLFELSPLNKLLKLVHSPLRYFDNILKVFMSGQYMYCRANQEWKWCNTLFTIAK